MDIIRMSLLSAVGGGGSGAQIGTKSVTANGTYQAVDDNLDGWRTFTVAVPLTSLEVLANGVYTADSGGYNVVDVKVKTWEEEYQEALEDLEDMTEQRDEYSKCCGQVARLLGTDANCDSMKKKIIQDIVPTYPAPTDPAADVTSASENTPVVYAEVSGNYVYVYNSTWSEWTYQGPSIFTSAHMMSRQTIYRDVYDTDGNYITTQTSVGDASINCANEPQTAAWCFAQLREELWTGQYPAYQTVESGAGVLHLRLRAANVQGYMYETNWYFGPYTS